MANLNLRNVPDELMKQLKKSAVEDGVSLRELCLGILGKVDRVEVHIPATELEKIREKIPLTKKDDSVVNRLLHTESKESQEASKRPRARKAPILKPEPQETPEIDDTEVPQWAEDQLNEMDEATEKLAANAVEMCTYKEYDSELGEWFGCRLPMHGPKVKHQRGDKL